MINFYNTENCLKSIYLDVIAENLNTQTNPLLTKIKQTSNDVWGIEIRKPIYHNEKYLQYISRLKNLYMEVEISEKSIRAGANNCGALVNILNGTLSDCLSKGRLKLSQSLYGNEEQPYNLTGIGAIFDTEKPIYGLERETAPMLIPLVKEVNEISDTIIEQTIDELAERGAKTDFIAVSQDVKYAYMQYAEKQNKKLDVVELDGGFRAFAINGIPFVFDRYVSKGCMYLLDTSVFSLHQLCDWQWLESDDGRILRKTPDNANTYTATLVKYADLICDFPNRQGMIKFLAE